MCGVNDIYASWNNTLLHYPTTQKKKQEKNRIGVTDWFYIYTSPVTVLDE